MMNIIEYARKPYPLSLNKWGIILSISLFISLFMVFFQPFGLQYLESERKSLLLAGYGLVTFCVLFVNMIFLPLIFPGIFKEERWTVFREVIWLLWIVITISSVNYVYSDLLSIVHWAGIKGFLFFGGFTLSIAIIPIVVVIILSHNRLLNKNLIASGEINQLIEDHQAGRMNNNKLVITSENENQKIETPASTLICFESEGNYVNTWYLQEGKIVRSMIRNTLKNIEPQIQEAGNLFKCHRAYIINLSYIDKVKGNSQGYRLQMKFLDKEIPVARNYSKPFREAIRKDT
jgi:hypothetical protein